MRSHVPCEFCQATPTQRYWVDAVGPDECPDLYDIFLWVCERHGEGLLPDHSAPESAKFMILADIKAAPVGFTALSADERHMTKTVFGWIFSNPEGELIDGSEVARDEQVEALKPVPTDNLIIYKNFPGVVYFTEGLPPLFRKAKS